MSSAPNPTPQTTTDSRRPSALTTTLLLGAVAIVGAGAAWAGYAGRPSTPAAPAAATTPAALAAPQGAPVSDIPPDAQALLDGGNAAFRAGQYEAALGHYRAAAARLPRHAAPWIGIHMAAQKLGKTALADSALVAVNERSDTPSAWDESAMRRAHDSARASVPAPRPPGGP
jgi:hypothetical protein